MEIWTPIDGFSYYEISNYGNVRSLPRGKKGKIKIISPRKTERGYFRALLSESGTRTFIFVHQLVAKAFIPNPDNKPFINHIDCNPSNNYVDNLEWCTAQENSTHAKSHKITACGTRNGNAKLTEDIVIYIHQCITDGVPLKFLAKKYGVHYDIILRIKDGRGWQHLGLEKITTRSMLLTLSQIEAVEKMIAQKQPYHQIQKETEVSKCSIINIKNGKYGKFKKRMQELATR